MATNIWIGTTTSWTATTNWSLGSAPASTNDVYLTANSQAIIANLSQSAVTLNSFNQDISYTGSIGNFTGASSDYLNIGATTFNLGQPSPSGSGNGSRRLNISAANSGATINVFSTASSGSDTGQFPVRLLGSNLTLNVVSGKVSIAALANETASITSLSTSGSTSTSTPSVYLGPGCTVTTANINSGSVVSDSSAAITTATVAGRNTTLTHMGTGGFGTLTVTERSTVNYNGSGNITTLNVLGTLDLSGGAANVTSANTNIYSGATIFDPAGRLTMSNITLVDCTMADITVNRGVGRIL